MPSFKPPPSRLQQRALKVLGATLGIAASSCGGQVREEALRKPLTDNLCEEGSAALLKNISATQDYSYLAIRETRLRPEDYLDDGYFADELAMNIAAREEALLIENEQERERIIEQIDNALAAFVHVTAESGSCEGEHCGPLPLPTSVGISSGYLGRRHLFSSDGNEARNHSSLSELEAFLGEIDTPNEAALLLYLTRGYRIPCDGNANYAKETAGYLLYAESGSTCGGDISGHRIFVSQSGEVTVEKSKVVEKGDKACIIGRLPPGLHTCDSDLPASANSIGAYFAQVSELEAASVAAFQQLARELAYHHAPQPLIDWALRAAQEETRHAILTRKLAEKYGCSWQLPLVASTSLRSLQAIAQDNAIEGLTRESFGALLAHHQALRAQDPTIAAVMRLIAQDETSHAEFSLALHDWLSTQLTPQQLSEVNRLRVTAQLEFSKTVHRDYNEELQSQAGLPHPDTSRELYERWFAV